MEGDMDTSEETGDVEVKEGPSEKNEESQALVLVDDFKKELDFPITEATLDVLPYIDEHYGDETVRAQVDALVAEEMEKSEHTPEEYLARSGYVEPELKFINSAFLQTEWERVLQEKPATPFDTSRYKVEPPPPEERTSLEAWQKAVQNAQAQLEHQIGRVVNLELLKRYGSAAWKSHTQTLAGMERNYEILLKKQKDEMDALNRKRKQEQVTAGQKLKSLQQDYFQYIQKNHEIEAACLSLQDEIENITKKKKDSGEDGEPMETESEKQKEKKAEGKEKEEATQEKPKEDGQDKEKTKESKEKTKDKRKKSPSPSSDDDARKKTKK